MSEVAEAFHGTEAELLATNLTPEQEERLLGAFGLHGRDCLTDTGLNPPVQPAGTRTPGQQQGAAVDHRRVSIIRAR
jgi:hypothetical protein